MTNRNPQFLQIEFRIPIPTKPLLNFDNGKFNQPDVNVSELVFSNAPLLKVVDQRLVKEVELGALKGVPVAGDGDADVLVRSRVLHRTGVHSHFVGNLVR